MKILITGALGQLGETLSLTLSNYNEVIRTVKNNLINEECLILDITNKVLLKEVINIVRPDLIINLAALTNVDYCEQRPNLAKQINLRGVENICEVFTGKIIQISTDYVFDGKNGPYLEEDKVCPISIYGKTKLDAEKTILNHNSNNLIIRTNVLYSENLNSDASFLGWVVNSLKNKKKINVVKDQFNNPTWTQSLTNVICLCIKNHISGLVNWGDKDYLNRYDFALKIAKVFNLDSTFIKPILTKDLNQVAKRPLKSGLISKKLENILNVSSPTIDECLEIIKGKN